MSAGTSTVTWRAVPAFVRELEDEVYADKRLAEMKEEVDSSRRAMSRGFPVTDKEWDEIHAWERKHLKEAHGIDVDETPNYGGAIGTHGRHLLPVALEADASMPHRILIGAAALL